MCQLLAPVRDITSFTAAAEAGADAVYFGIGKLNMRANSPGIEPEKLHEIVEKAHRKDIKVYITLNTIIYDNEITELGDMLEKIKKAGTDAVICSDIAVIEMAKKTGIPFHISTQANISNIHALKFYAELGAERAVLARELNLEQIKIIKQQSPIEIETFIHGAMCISVSGRCYMSHYLFGASANRGRCYQPCRREYLVNDTDEGMQMKIGTDYVLSPKDLCTLGILDKLIDAGIDCFKIEGRSRSPEYIKTVTAAYRKAIDAIKQNRFTKTFRDTLMDDLRKVYNRGFSTGFYLGRPGGGDFAETEGSAATVQKIAVGKILNYYPRISVAYAVIQASPLSSGDIVQIQGPTTGVLEFKVEQLRDTDRREHKIITKGKVTFPCPAKVRPNDKLFKIIASESNN